VTPLRGGGFSEEVSGDSEGLRVPKSGHLPYASGRSTMGRHRKPQKGLEGKTPDPERAGRLLLLLLRVFDWLHDHL
jgi:hypothetical protein